MSKPTTHVLMVTDMSGSMSGLAEDVRGGFNTYVDSLRADKTHKYRLTVTLFDNRFETLCTAAKLAEVPQLTAQNYGPRGGTALLDAVGRTLAEFDRRVPELADDERVLVVVQTDGHENASVEFTRTQIAQQIKDREATGAWSFLFLGAGPDAWAQAGGMGFAASQVVRTAKTSQGTRDSYTSLSAATFSVAAGATGAQAAEEVRKVAGDPDA